MDARNKEKTVSHTQLAFIAPDSNTYSHGAIQRLNGFEYGNLLLLNLQTTLQVHRNILSPYYSK